MGLHKSQISLWRKDLYDKFVPPQQYKKYFYNQDYFTKCNIIKFYYLVLIRYIQHMYYDYCVWKICNTYVCILTEADISWNESRNEIKLPKLIKYVNWNKKIKVKLYLISTNIEHFQFLDMSQFNKQHVVGGLQTWHVKILPPVCEEVCIFSPWSTPCCRGRRRS